MKLAEHEQPTTPDDVAPPITQSEDVSTAKSVIPTILRKTRRAYQVPVMFEVALWLIAVMCAFTVTGFAIGWFAGESGPQYFYYTITIGLGVTGFAGLVAFGLLFFRPPALSVVAGDIERSASEFRNDITSSLEFIDGVDAAYGWSVAFVDEHILSLIHI